MLTDTLKKVNGRTRFQKLMFLIQKKTETDKTEGLDFKFEIYLYGPFSRELSSAIDDLVNKRYLEEGKTETGLGYTRYEYKLTEKGRHLLAYAKGKKLVSTSIQHAINEIAKDYGETALPELVEKAYEEF
jgi:uncharacterized protein YwgA